MLFRGHSPCVVLVLLVTSFSGLTSGLFEDQVFKFDWATKLVGKVTQADFWENSRGQSALLVRTEKNVLASLDADSGRIKWRHVFAENDLLRDLDLGSKSLRTVSVSPASGLLALRSWNPVTGALTSDNSVPVASPNADLMFIADEEVSVLTLDDNGGINGQIFGFKSGEESRTVKLATGSGEKLQCESTDSFLVCLAADSQLAYYTGLPLEKKSSLNAVQLGQLGLPAGFKATSVRRVSGTADLAALALRSEKDGAVESFLLKLADGKMKGSQHLKSTSASSSTSSSSLVSVTGCRNTEDLLVLEQKCVGKSCESATPSRVVKVTKLKGFTKNVHTMTYENIGGRIESAFATCLADEDGEAVYQVVITTEDGAMTSLTPSGSEMWTREEALSGIAKVEFVSATHHVDNEVERASSVFEGSSDVVEAFLRRVKHHAALVQSTITHLMEIRDPKTLLDLLIGSSDRIMDNFGIRKVIVAASVDGKVFGIDNKNGKILWSNSYPINRKGKLDLFTQRASSEEDEGVTTLIFTNRLTGKQEMVSFNPQNGDDRPGMPLAGKLSQAILLHHADEQQIRPILFLFDNGKVQLEPASAAATIAKAAPKTFVVTKDAKSQTVRGQTLNIEGDSVTLRPVWTMANPSAEVISVVGKNTEEIVHSQGRVMADRSVLFKYINPNLALVLTEGVDAAGKNFINVYLVDLVTGRIVFSTHHKRVAGPYHVIHSENWAVYTYYNEKSRRAELTSLELFEGSTQSNATVFSSLTTKVLSPLVERQSYILGPTHIAALRDTTTEKGITTKHILMATSNGAIYDVPRQFLDPRRPNVNTPPEMREPGLPPYIPELQLPQELIINYNQTISGVRGMVTAPTGLESTSVVFAYGLDLYCTRVAPSKGFDLLKDDFDHYVITIVLCALIAAAFITKKLSQRKALKQAWR